MRFGLLILGVTLATLALSTCICTPPTRMDPAVMAEDPSAFLGDDRDRRAAKLVDASRDTDLESLVSRPGTEQQVVDILLATAAKAGNREALGSGTIPHHAPRVLLIRRARATCAAAAGAMASDDETARSWGIDAFEVVESRCRGGPSSEEPGPPYEGPERDAAIRAVARILTADPDPALRKRAVRLMYHVLPDHDEPSVEAIAAALARDKDDDARDWLLCLLAARKAPAPLLLSAAMHGYTDPVTVSTGIYHLFVEENRELIEKAYSEGDAVGRAGIGETFYRHQSPMPWAEAVILLGLSDPDSKVRAFFAKGTMVLRPFNKTVRARLEAMADDVPNAAWALSVEAEDRPEDR